jgi:hypothetical protein
MSPILLPPKVLKIENLNRATARANNLFRLIILEQEEERRGRVLDIIHRELWRLLLSSHLVHKSNETNNSYL